ncbi:SDR family NAD(P)-dependent oxidoreductase [Frankia sp. CNm7]|uniref:SDR family NAD(P)-dependent oxidoreductase n=1 Tax=Frankia nepalensis TaxID=1836974 RepID=A0A937RHL0_9ACTN|nr:SDR family NAD(P)-dependent oxidoreductase [Frankia nepalensis]MBL7500607.1 SDR family NAD(P)-dependent oxidoreductase [Frankia nepalensis]MBL7510992.1 SDR family NAD(P)-dependent oxidoreductase [Frankia nepalensis]MBL7518491.1 SDR family NAD(P)-dependent oxidoreductase [Frankia nepalensis]MBL7630297.1 SDR family NAD(P)-dependent oxidoreductase [Frankia nepalensis]
MGATEGRVALVTGASRGIGAAIAIRLAAEGAAVALTARTVHDGDRDDPGSLAGVIARIEEAGGKAVAFAADLSRPDGGREGLVARVEERLGPLDILVNNAGMGGYMPFLDITDPRIDTVFEVNLRSPWELCRQALPGMRQRRRGWIVNVGSAAAEHPLGPPYRDTLPNRQGSLYGSSKAALHRFTTSLAAETYGEGIAVNVLAPDAAVKVRDNWPFPDAVSEPVETMAEAALVLATCDPGAITGRVAYSLSLLVELGRPVRVLDGSRKFAGWQPHEIPHSRLRNPPQG